MTYEIKQYTDDEGKLVTARISINPKTLIPFNGGPSDIKFFGTYMVPHPQMGQIRMEFEFPEGWTLDKCFEEFKSEAEKDFKRIQEEAQKQATAQLWTPGSKGGLIVPK